MNAPLSNNLWSEYSQRYWSWFSLAVYGLNIHKDTDVDFDSQYVVGWIFTEILMLILTSSVSFEYSQEYWCWFSHSHWHGIRPLHRLVVCRLHHLRTVHRTHPVCWPVQQWHAEAHDGSERENAQQDDQEGHVQGPALWLRLQLHVPWSG